MSDVAHMPLINIKPHDHKLRKHLSIKLYFIYIKLLLDTLHFSDTNNMYIKQNFKISCIIKFTVKVILTGES